MASDTRFVHALALGVDSEWRRLGDAERRRSARAFAAACEPADGAVTLGYSLIGLRSEAELLLWSMGPSLEAVEERAAASLRAGLGRWAAVRESFFGVLTPSPYVRRRRPAEPRPFGGAGARYLIVYPFTKGGHWYRLGAPARQAIMAEHMRVGRRYPQVRQLLASSFGVDDQDHLVAYGTDELAAFSRLVRELRGTDARRYTTRDIPVLAGVRRPLAAMAG